MARQWTQEPALTLIQFGDTPPALSCIECGRLFHRWETAWIAHTPNSAATRRFLVCPGCAATTGPKDMIIPEKLTHVMRAKFAVWGLVAELGIPVHEPCAGCWRCDA